MKPNNINVPHNKPIIAADTKTCAFIKEYLASLEPVIECDYQENEALSGQITIHSTHLTQPIRIGQIIDILLSSSREKPSTLLNFQDGVLDIAHATFHNNLTNITSRLTEKEVAILTYLQSNKDKFVQRTELLSAVWDYAENVETHTLETHIYRLRQKIEADPANPSILITQDNGYKVL